MQKKILVALLVIFFQLNLFFLFQNKIAEASGCQGGSLVCGDCNENGSLSILDALEASQIAAALIATPNQDKLERCDVNNSGDVTIIDALLIAQASVGLSTYLGCYPVRTIYEGQSELNSDLYYADTDRLNPDFSCTGTTVFYEVITQPSTTEIEIIISNMSFPTDVDLFIGSPTTIPGDLNANNYQRRSVHIGATTERYTISCSGLSAYQGAIPVAVHSYEPGLFNIAIVPRAGNCSCSGAAIIAPGVMHSDNISAYGGPCPPNPCGSGSDRFELSYIPTGTDAIDFVMRGPNPPYDYDLWIGYPGVCGGDCNVTNYHGTSPGTPGMWGNPLFRESYAMSSLELNSYIQSSQNIAFGVSVYDGPGGALGNYTVGAFTRGSGGAINQSVTGLSPREGSIANCYYPPDFPPNNKDEWSFIAYPGNTITASVDVIYSGGAFDPALSLYDSFGSLLAQSDDSQTCTVTPPLKGSGTALCPFINYIVPMSSPTQEYTLSVSRSPNGFCLDSLNGRYRFATTINGAPALLILTGDDVP